jgi:hypothetical protein
MACRGAREELTVVPWMARRQKEMAKPSANAYPSRTLATVENADTHTCGWTRMWAMCHWSMSTSWLAISTATEAPVTAPGRKLLFR